MPPFTPENMAEFEQMNPAELAEVTGLAVQRRDLEQLRQLADLVYDRQVVIADSAIRADERGQLQQMFTALDFIIATEEGQRNRFSRQQR